MGNDKNRKAIIGLLDVTSHQGLPPGRPLPPAPVVDVIDMEQTIGELQKKDWKKIVGDIIAEKGYDPVAVNILAADHPKGFTVAVSVVETKKGIQERKRPVTRGGREIGAPVKGKTMAAKRRNRGKFPWTQDG